MVVDDVVDGLAVYRHRAGPVTDADGDGGADGAPGSGDVHPVVLVHGSMDRAASFLKAVRRMPDLELVRYDRRGYGRSVGAGTAAGIDEQVDDLLAVMGGRPAVVVGHSLGGVIALAAAERHPQLVPSVGAFEAPMPWTDWWPGVSAGGAAVAAARTVGPEDAAEQFMRRMIGDERWERLPSRTRAERRSEGPALLAELGAIRGAPPYDPRRVTVPVVSGYGTESKPYHQQAAQALADLAPRGELVVIEGAGHAAQSSHPEAFAGFVRRVLARAERPD
jgi:pimeloyl-ACP methyl ester carboxylesterase